VEGLSLGVQQDREVEPHLLRAAGRSPLCLCDIDGDDDEAATLHLPHQTLDPGHLFHAGLAPTRPKVEQDHLTTPVGEAVHGPAQIRQFQGRGWPGVQGAQLPGQTR
jgi:hypothetical protein